MFLADSYPVEGSCGDTNNFVKDLAMFEIHVHVQLFLFNEEPCYCFLCLKIRLLIVIYFATANTHT